MLTKTISIWLTVRGKMYFCVARSSRTQMSICENLKSDRGASVRLTARIIAWLMLNSISCFITPERFFSAEV